MKKLISLIYFLGSLVTLILLLITISQSSYVLFPDAMLPMELHELTSIWLAIGFFPMFVVTLFFKHFCSRKIIFLPSIICSLFLIFYVVIIFEMLSN